VVALGTHGDSGSEPHHTDDVSNQRVTIGKSYSGRHNSLNFLRLVLALLVVVSHAIVLGGYGSESIFGKTTLGTMAVYGFFGISGFLIAGSAVHNDPGNYFWRRFLRILPGFWVCLLVTAFFFGLVGWLTGTIPAGYHSGASAYFSAPHGPIEFCLQNILLQMRQLFIVSRAWVPAWNGSLWTLFYEFLCYILLGGLAVLGCLRRRWIVLALLAVSWVAEAAITITPSANHQFNHLSNYDGLNLLTFVPIFLTGAVIWLYRDKIPDSGVLALGCSVLFVISLWLPFGAHAPGFSLTSSNIFGPTLAYPILWLGIHLPFQKIGARNDYSYGVYIYAYPVQVLLAIWGVQHWGYPAYLLLSVLGTVPFAVASWWLVEERCLRLKDRVDGSALWIRMVGPSRPKETSAKP